MAADSLGQVESAQEVPQVVRASGVDKGPPPLHGPVDLRLGAVAELVGQSGRVIWDQVLAHGHLQHETGTVRTRSVMLLLTRKPREDLKREFYRNCKKNAKIWTQT